MRELSLADTFSTFARSEASYVRAAPGAALGADDDRGVLRASLQKRFRPDDVGPTGGGSSDAGTSTPETDKSSGDAQAAPRSSSNANGYSWLGPVKSRPTGPIRSARDTALRANTKTALENILRPARALAGHHNAVL